MTTPSPQPPAAPPPAPVARSAWTGWSRPTGADVVRSLASALVVVVVFGVVGLIGGFVWFHLWTPPAGEAVVLQGQHGWAPYRGDSLKNLSANETSLGQYFGGTGLFVLVGLVGGLVLGLLAGFLRRGGELVTVVAVAAGAALATYACYRLGVHYSPPDPAVVAAHAKPFTAIPGDLRVSGPGAYLVWGIGSMFGLAVAYLLTPARPPSRRLSVLLDQSGAHPGGLATYPEG